MSGEATDRRSSIERTTAETTIQVTLDLDGSGEATVETGVGFFDHMLTALATHGMMDLDVAVDGDLDVDEHHTIEDVGIVLGQAIDEALGDRSGIVRFADRRVPLDEALATVVLDVSGRPGWYFRGTFSQEQVGGMTSQLAGHFFRSLVTHAGITAHAEVRGENAHHELEALFKGFARALDDATRQDERRGTVPSTKGTVE